MNDNNEKVGCMWFIISLLLNLCPTVLNWCGVLKFVECKKCWTRFTGQNSDLLHKHSSLEPFPLPPKSPLKHAYTILKHSVCKLWSQMLLKVHQDSLIREGPSVSITNKISELVTELNSLEGIKSLFWLSNIFLDPKCFWTQNFFEPKNLMDPKYFRTTFFLTQIVLDPKFFWTQNFLDPKFFWIQNFFRPFFLDPKFF